MTQTKVDHIYIHESTPDYRIIVYREALQTSVNQINEYFDRVIEIAGGSKFHMVADISNTNLPNVEVRLAIKERFCQIDHQIISHHTYVGKNPLLRVALKFVSHSVGLPKTVPIKSMEEAFNIIRNEY